MPKILGLLKPKTTKARNFLIILSVAIVIISLLAIFILKQPDAANVGKAKLNAVPDDVQFEAGGKNLSQEYLKTLMKSEKLKYEDAVKTGKSSIPTYVQTGDEGKPTGTLFSDQNQVCSPSCFKLINERYSKYNTPTNLLQKWVKQGRLLSSTAAELNKLDKQSQAESEYKKALDALVKAGKLTADQEKSLLNAYKKEHALLTGPLTVGELIDLMVKDGDLAPKDGADLRSLVDQGVTVKKFKLALNDLVDNGRLSQPNSDKLYAAYQREKGPENLKDISTTSGLIDQLQRNGQMSEEVAKALKALESIPVAISEFEKALKQFENQGKLSPDAAQRLLAMYKTEHPDTSADGKNGMDRFQQVQAQRDAQAKKEEEKREAATRAAQARQLQAQEDAARLRVEQKAMTTQMQSLIKAWNPTPQTYVVLPIKEQSEAQGQLVKGPDGKMYQTQTGGKNNIPMIKAGDILFAVLNTAVNSDQPGPVMATIVNGKYKGAKLLGTLKTTSDHERVILQFNSMTMPSWADVVAIKAVAINPDTARTAVASDVDHHYLLRYSMLFASGFMQGLSEAVQNSGSTDINDSGTTKTTHPKLNTAEKTYVALGKVGQQFSSAAQKVFNRKPTVKVNVGVGLGILFTDSVHRYPIKPANVNESVTADNQKAAPAPREGLTTAEQAELEKAQ